MELEPPTWAGQLALPIGNMRPLFCAERSAVPVIVCSPEHSPKGAIMDDKAVVFQIGGWLVTVYVVLAAAYYAEAVRWNKGTGKSNDKSRTPTSEKNSRRAEKLFRVCCAIIAITVVCVTLPHYADPVAVGIWCRWALLLPVVGLVVMCVVYVLGKYVVSLR